MGKKEQVAHRLDVQLRLIIVSMAEVNACWKACPSSMGDVQEELNGEVKWWFRSLECWKWVILSLHLTCHSMCFGQSGVRILRSRCPNFNTSFKSFRFVQSTKRRQNNSKEVAYLDIGHILRSSSARTGLAWLRFVEEYSASSYLP